MSTSPVIQDWTQPQLNASSSAATTSGVPLNIVRGVTGFKYGAGATPADFNYVAGQLAGWYTHFYGQSGDALVAWEKAAGQEMGSTASALDVSLATASQSEVTTGMTINPALVDVLGDVASGVLGGIDDTVGGVASDASGIDGTSLSDVEGQGTASDQTASGTTDTSPDDSGGSGSGASTAAKAAAGLGLAGLLGATGWAGLLVRALEALAGAALILLGLQALTGQGDSGHPVKAVSKVTRSVL